MSAVGTERCENCQPPTLPEDYLLMNTAQLEKEGSPPYIFCTEQCLVAELLHTLEMKPRHIRQVLRRVGRS